jgi:hypothetical protein
MLLNKVALDFVGWAPAHQNSEPWHQHSLLFACVDSARERTLQKFCHQRGLLLGCIDGGREPTLQARVFSHRLTMASQYLQTTRVTL